MKKNLLLVASVALVATVAFAATSPDRLKNSVLIGDGAAGTKSLSFDIGGSNPLIESVSGVLKLSTDGGSTLMTVPAATDTIVGKATTDTLTNKTIGSSGVGFSGSSSGTMTLVAPAAAGSGTLTLPVATDTLVGKATSDTLTNKTLTLPTIGGTGATFSGSTSGTTVLKATAVAGTTTLTLPAATDTLVGLDTTDTLTNKRLTSPKLNENVALTTTATKLNYLTSATGTTGTASGNIVFDASPTIATPALTGAWTATGNLTLTKTSDLLNILYNSATTGGSVLTLKSGNGTTSTNNQYIEFQDSDSSQVTWDVGHVGSNNLSFYNQTAGSDRMTLTSTGDLTITGGLTTGYVTSQASTFTDDGTGPGTSASVTMHIQKVGDYVTIHVPPISLTCGSGSPGTVTANTAVGTDYRPATTTQFGSFNLIRDAGAGATTAGIFQIGTNGKLAFRKVQAGGFTASGSCGTQQPVTVTYYVGSGS